MSEQYRGVFPAVVTAFDAHGEIDPDAQMRLSRWLIDQGCRGLFVCGGTGEGVLLAEEERRTILEATMEAVGADATIIAHVGAVSPLETYRLAEHAARAGAHAVAAIPGAYFTPDADGLVQHYRRLAEIAQRPTLLYHIPSRTGVSLDLATVARLAAIPHVAGLKFTDHNLLMLQCMRRQQGDGFLIMSGSDELMVPAKLMGSTGTIGSWYNIIPGVFIAAFEYAERGDWAAAAERQGFANDLICRHLGPQLVALCKVALAEMGIDVGEPRMPLPRLDASARAAFVAELRSGGYIEA